MATKRMTGKDYRKEYEQHKKSQESLYEHAKSRLLELGKIHPDAIIGRYGDCDLLAKSMDKQWIDWLIMEEVCNFIEMIEKWSNDKQNYKQLEI